jgi:hypothetical protein
MKEIPLTHGKVALVDDCDFEWLNQWGWSTETYKLKNRTIYYAARNAYLGGGKANPIQKHIKMHRLIAAEIGVDVVDHKDGDGLNNQRINLRPSTRAQNGQNRRKAPGCKSKFKGVSWIGRIQKWQAAICVNKKGKYLGVFSLESDAAIAYNNAAIEHFGEFALLNAVN